MIFGEAMAGRLCIILKLSAEVTTLPCTYCDSKIISRGPVIIYSCSEFRIHILCECSEFRADVVIM